MRRAKLTQSGIDPIRYAAALTPVTVEVKGLDGNASKHQQNPVRTAMMAILVLAGSTATLGGVAEDKKERVFQMLLIAATPFELIAGKMFGTVCVSLTNASIWLALSIGALYSFGLIRSAPIEMLPWFLVYLVCQITMLSATGAAIGARVGSPREEQQFGVALLFPTMLFRDRIAIWRPWAALAGIVVGMAAGSSSASRVFLAALLMQGTRPKLADVARWVPCGSL